jgi:solute carrier family 30 (zinc transporter), member 1
MSSKAIISKIIKKTFECINSGHSHGHGGGKKSKRDSHDSHHSHGSDGGGKAKGSEAMATQGIFLHALGDALGNVGVIIAALIQLNVHAPWVIYVDPVISFILAFVIGYPAISLLKATGALLLQGVPEGVNMKKLKKDLIKSFQVCFTFTFNFRKKMFLMVIMSL